MSQNLEDTVAFATADDFASRFFVAPTRLVDVSCGGASHVGKVRDNNEDHFAVIHRSRSQHFLLTNLARQNLPAFRDEAFALIVADGIGGAAAGELASRLVMEEAWELSAQASSWVMKLHELSDQQARERIEAYASRMHEKLHSVAHDNPKLEGMGTTWTSAYIVGWDAILAHIGDSRAYLYRDRQLQQLTRDHTLAQALVDRGVSPEETKYFRHLVTNTLGGKNSEVSLDVEHVALQSGDRLLLCTDGLSDLVDNQQIADIIRATPGPQDACDALIKKALEHGGKDNVTAVLAAFREVK